MDSVVLYSQANGLDERYNQTIQNMLMKFANDKKELWYEYFDTCVYAYNTSVHESKSYSPFEVMYGHRAVLPIDIEMGNGWLDCKLRQTSCAHVHAERRVYISFANIFLR